MKIGSGLIAIYVCAYSYHTTLLQIIPHIYSPPLVLPTLHPNRSDNFPEPQSSALAFPAHFTSLCLMYGV